VSESEAAGRTPTPGSSSLTTLMVWLQSKDTLPGLPSLCPALSVTDAPRLNLCFAAGRRCRVCTYWAWRDVPSWHLRCRHRMTLGLLCLRCA